MVVKFRITVWEGHRVPTGMLDAQYLDLGDGFKGIHINPEVYI